ncbi:hypothetical protein PHYPSEUDO_003954 [Phytophthora pseudosyringae]|uniref:TKL protein kinase n=1 Tax=Phytophthora pseudosyringae TaxID=221518 RepID=A0A8T1VPH7_9STRA|nr:hypothetical protein PHYPSEUDO_003954 [Phytophthora pseudosyringae]
MLRRVLVAALVALTVKVATADKKFAIQATYLGDQCGGTPYVITVYEDENCTATTCDSYDLSYGSRSVNANMMTNDCSSNYQELMQLMRDKFSNSPYLLQTLHTDENCTEFSMAFGYPAMGACVGAYNESDGLYAVASLNTNGSASLGLYYERTCFANQQYMATFVSKDELATHSCTIDWFRWYSSNDAKTFNGSASALTEDPSGRSLSSGALAGIGLGGFGFAIVLAVAVVARRRQASSRASDKFAHFESSMTPTAVDSLEARVALGIVKVEFSDASPKAIVELGRACTSVYPTERPTAAEALYQLQLILSRKKDPRAQSASDLIY